MIPLLNFLNATGISFNQNSFKIHLASASTDSNDLPLDAYFKGKFEPWQNEQTQKNFKCEHVISLIDLKQDRWLFVGVYEVNGDPELKNEKHWYNLTLLPNQEKLIGRVIVSYKRNARSSYRWGTEIIQDFTIGEILPEKMTIAPYPGHNKVRTTYSELKLIIEQEERTWLGALSTVKGIYCITDCSEEEEGRHYIGKAVGDNGIWQRWKEYVKTGHGGNKGLKNLLKEKGDDHKTNFQFSLLEIADLRIPEKDIDARESHWKEVLRTREFGYNEN